MKRTFAVLICSLFVATACSRAESHTMHSIDVSNPIEAEIKITPQQIKVDEAVSFSVTVKQAGEPVDDANEVKFEIWQKDQDNHEFINAEHKGSGVYATTKKFAEAGDYYVMHHVTAREFHSMKKTQFTVAAKK